MLKKIKVAIAIMMLATVLCISSTSLADEAPEGGGKTDTPPGSVADWGNVAGEVTGSPDGAGSAVVIIEGETAPDGTPLVRVVTEKDRNEADTDRDNRRFYAGKEDPAEVFKDYEKITPEEYKEKYKDSDEALFVELDEGTVVVIPLGFAIRESEISRAISTLKSANAGISWYPANFDYQHPSLEILGSHIEDWRDGCASWTDDKGVSHSYCAGHSVPHKSYVTVTEGYWDYYWMNAAPINDKVQADNLPSFKPLFTKQAVDSTGTRSSLATETKLVTSYEYEGVVWRGTDKPRILSGPKEMSGAGRAENGATTQKFLVKMVDDASKGDRQTTSTCSYCGASLTVNHSTTYTRDYPANITIKTYRGVAKPTGSETSTSNFILPMLISNNTTYHASGRMIQSSTPVTFYPTIRMTWQNVSQYGSKNDASVRSEQISTLIPNNYAEAGWFNESYESNKPTMNLKSNQWSTHVRATQPDSKIKDSDTWRGINQVLPGGAIYGLDIPESANTKLKLATWQFFIPSSEQSKFQSGASEYSLSSAIQHHKDYVDEAKKVLESYRVVQWVNDDVSAEYAWSPGGVLINGPSSSLTGLEGLSGNASTEDKYYLRPNPVESNPPTGNRGDLDILDEQLKNVFIKCYSDTSGNIYLAYAFDEGSIVGAKGIKICDKKTTWQQIKSGAIKSNIDSALPHSLAGLEEKTYFVTNFVKSIERNTGNDSSASWAPDGKWYNEAFEAVYMVYQETNLEVGFATPKQRTAALDPKLCPINTGRADLYSKAFLSQFRIQPLSDSGIASGQNNWFVAKFRGVPILMQDLEDVYVTRKFYIPNVNVQDLQNW